jgi:signal recognition particle subunit SRP54
VLNHIISPSDVILKKLDGDSRAGAAFAMKHVTGVRMKLVGTGEKPADFSIFHPK